MNSLFKKIFNAFYWLLTNAQWAFVVAIPLFYAKTSRWHDFKNILLIYGFVIVSASIMRYILLPNLINALDKPKEIQ